MEYSHGCKRPSFHPIVRSHSHRQPLRNPDPRGSLWVYSPDKAKNAKPGLLTLKGYPEGHDFHPLGIDIYPSRSGGVSNMFVINHARERSFIEQFTLSPGIATTATWVRTISHNFFVAPNSLTLTSPTAFYVSNDHLMTRRLPFPLNEVLPLAESVLALPLGWVGHVSIEPETGAVNYEFIKFGLPFPNGIAISRDGSQVAVAGTVLSHVTFYSRNTTSNTLAFNSTVPVPFNADNVRFDDEDNLIVTGHPHFPSLVEVAAKKPGALSPSWVMSLSPRTQSTVGAPNLVTPKSFDLKAPISASSRVSAALSHDAQTLFQSNGSVFQTSSTGLRDARTGVLYLVGLYEEGLFICRP